MKPLFTICFVTFLFVACDPPLPATPEPPSTEHFSPPDPQITVEQTGSGCTDECDSNADCDSGGLPVCVVAACASPQGPCSTCSTHVATNWTYCADSGRCCRNTHGTCDATCDSLSCADGYADCNADVGDGCETSLATPKSCGAGCGALVDCTLLPHVGSADCQSGQCAVLGCAAGWANCDGNATNGCETSIGTDVDNCGGCGAACARDHVANAYCVGGACQATCQGGYGDCNGDPRSDGCEAALATTAAHCGSCATDCQALVVHSGSAPQCQNGSCDYAGECAPGWGDCDGDRQNGCETSTLTDAAHCGGCGTACLAPAGGTALCVGGACDFACEAGQKKCNGACSVCCSDGDCSSPPDGDRCKVGRCQAGQCAYVEKSCVVRECRSSPQCDPKTGECESTPLTGGTCGTTGCCAAAGSCLDGACQCSSPKDCGGSAPCQAGFCDAQTGACGSESLANGTACVGTDRCAVDTVCVNGQCRGAPKSCTTNDPCRAAHCEASDGSCQTTLVPIGTPCTTDDACVQNSACDAAGQCVGVTLPDGTPCAATCPGAAPASCGGGVCRCADAADLGAGPLDAASADAATSDAATPVAGGDHGCTAGGASPSAAAASIVVLWLVVSCSRGGRYRSRYRRSSSRTRPA